MKNWNERVTSQEMEQRLCEVLSGNEGNYINPFFWQNGGAPDTIRQEMGAIYQSGIREVCVESRVHPDFLGDGWWETLDVILEEAGRRGMRVWVLDDAHFPTGYANGRVKEHLYARKRYLDCYHIDAVGPLKGNGFLIHLEEGEELIAVTAGKKGAVGKLTGVKGIVCHQLTEVLDLTDQIKESLSPADMNRGKNPGVRDIVLYWDVPEGIWTVNVIKVVEGGTGRKDYINTIDKEAVGLLLKTAYEPHYQRYSALFGREFAGFFSDEPEIGNVLSEYGQNAELEGKVDLADKIPSCGNGWQVSLMSYDGSMAGERPLERLVDLTGKEGDPMFSGKMTYVTEFPGSILEEDGSALKDGREEYLLRPEKTNGAAVLFLHGHGGGKEMLVTNRDEEGQTFAEELAREGFLVFCPDERGSGERRERFEQGDSMEASWGNSHRELQQVAIGFGQSMVGWAVWDLMRLVDHIETMPEVEKDRIGCTGFSGGGQLTLWLAALDERIRAAMTGGYFYVMKDALVEMCNNCACDYVPFMWKTMDMGDLGALVAPRALFIENGMADGLSGHRGLENVYEQVAITEKAYALYEAEERLVHRIHSGGHVFSGVGVKEFFLEFLGN